MTGKLAYTRFDMDLEARLSELHRDGYGVERNKEYWEWKYVRNPAGRDLMFLGVTENKVVGHVGTIPIRMKVGQKCILASQTVDIVVLPEYQKGTPFFRLEKLAREECKRNAIGFNFGFSVKRTYRVSTKTLGFRGVCPITKLVKIFDPTLFLQKRIQMKPLCTFLGSMVRHSRKVQYGRRVNVPPEYDMIEVERFDNTFDEFWQHGAQKYDIMVKRDSTYLNWRYADNPSEHYTIFALERSGGGSLRGFIVLSCRQNQVKRGHIVDVLTAKDDDSAVTLLLEKALAYFIRDNVHIVSCWALEHTVLFRTLRKMGFFMRQTPHNLIVRSFIPDIPNEYLTQRKKWYVTMGDSDFV